VHDDLYNGLKAEVEEATRIFLERGWSAERVLNDALVEGMRIVGIDFRDGILFVPEVLLAANAMKAGMEILRRCSRRPARADRQDRHRHREGRHPRHRQELSCR
jgi:methanogenic corrinoid protein MtbC1